MILHKGSSDKAMHKDKIIRHAWYMYLNHEYINSYSKIYSIDIYNVFLKDLWRRWKFQLWILHTFTRYLCERYIWYRQIWKCVWNTAETHKVNKCILSSDPPVLNRWPTLNNVEKAPQYVRHRRCRPAPS